jgi:sulfite reductase (ferredoxin)
MARTGKDRIREMLAPFAVIPSFQQDPEFYKDWGHDNEKFAIRSGIKGECAGATVQEKAPVMATAKGKLEQAEAFFAHGEYAHAQLEAYEAMAEAARVPLYAHLVDPFSSEQAIWEFENIFVRSARSSAEWMDFAERLEREKKADPTGPRARALIDLAKKHLTECDRLAAEISRSQSSAPKV